MTLARLVIMRHGETDWNRATRMQGHRDIPLNAVGLAQVNEAMPSIAAMRPQIIVSSDLRRATATAAAIAAELGIAVRADERLRETALGQWEGLERAEVRAQWPQQWAAWRSRGATVSPPGGESRTAVAARAAEVVDELDAAEATSALLVTHGGLIVGLVCHLLGLPVEHWGFLIGVGNCHWATLHRVHGEWRLNSYNNGFGGLVLPAADEAVADG